MNNGTVFKGNVGETSEFKFSVALCPQRPYRLLRMGTSEGQGGAYNMGFSDCIDTTLN